MTSTFKVGAACRFSSHSFTGRAGFSPIIFVFYLSYLPSEALSLVLSISPL